MVKFISSKEISEIVDIPHKNILQKIEGRGKLAGIIPTLENANIDVSDYFIKSTYKDKQSRTKPCYLCTKLGCELLCNKITGKKGIILSALFQKTFEELLRGENYIYLNYDVKEVCDTLRETSKRKEVEFLDKLEKALEPFGLRTERQYLVERPDGNYYRIDFYIASKNVAIEYDEDGHKGYSYEKHEGRQNYIEYKLGCKFIRVTDENSDEYNIGYIIKNLFDIDYIDISCNDNDWEEIDDVDTDTDSDVDNSRLSDWDFLD